ncbi:MAG: protein-L-isoaspartate(D-aspartate) O-methyltransferase [Planctomycetota bacterium]|jgi:protein-L-isoaspartate(D-aspartate) O-methyltransferase
MIGLPHDDRRERMVRERLAGRGIRDERVLAAFRRVPRHRLVPEKLAGQAYEDHPLDIGFGQTISQPYMVAHMTQELEISGGERVLEVGTGSGYQCAILAEMGARVRTIERIAELSNRARRALEGLGYTDVQYRVGDGTLGWPEEAPFDRIIVTAGAPSLPVALTAQIAEGGRMVIPIGDAYQQDLFVVRKEGGFVKKKRTVPCIFVKLLGKEGW